MSHSWSASSGMNSMNRTSYGSDAGELREPQHLVLGEAAQRDRVDLDRAQLGVGLGGLEPVEHAAERVAPRELEEAVGGERVERDVDAPQAGRDEVARPARSSR